MSLQIIVLAKQVPDTRNVGGNAINKDGTVNRSVLPVIFNPEDLNALELAFSLKEQYSGSVITLLTMGPPRAAEIIREGLFRGIDIGYLLTDRVFAGSDTLATSYILYMAIKKIGVFDIIISGRQAIDGDTAQVGPQVAEKLKIPQITYVEKIQSIKNSKIVAERRLERGVEIVECELPILVTVNASASECRPRNARLVQKYKHAKTLFEKKIGSEIYTDLYNIRPYLNLVEWNATDIKADNKQCGFSGSPTKVKKIENVVFKVKDSRRFNSSDSQIEEFILELIKNHAIV
ncbi:MAG: electron transfer flavoprotein subunit beta/FixA family protein [Bacteroidales bacterium OttesenSCG-928-I14]|jgi:electron transfer flavoprotein beta subunit|nr:electron transfer flavoprotein subunit beta/FixA family protein [Bacteroidales bacterium OttesenSCG-928-I14]